MNVQQGGTCPPCSSFLQPVQYLTGFSGGAEGTGDTAMASRSEARGTAWVILQDIGGFTARTEALYRKGSAGAETLARMVRAFLQEAEAHILPYGGRVVALVGDAYWAILSGHHPPQTLHRIAQTLLHIPALQRHRLRTRVVAVRGPIRLAPLPSGAGVQWDLEGYPVDLATREEEELPAGQLRVLDLFPPDSLDLPPLLPPGRLSELSRFRTLTVAFGEFQEGRVEDLVLLLQRYRLLLAKWIPHPRRRRGLIVAGYPYAEGHDPERMMDTLLELRQRGLLLRAGVARGRVFLVTLRGTTFQELTFLGDPLNVAARLLALAQEGEILAAGELSPRRYLLRERGTTPLRGRTHPVRIVAVEDRKLADAPEGSPSPPLVGRRRELRKLQTHLRQEGARIALVGPPGVGKTRLVREVLPRLPLRTLWIQGYAAHTPLMGLRMLLREGGAAPPLIQAFLNGKGVDLERVVQELTRWLVERGPTLVVLDHVHGLDPESLDLLARALNDPATRTIRVVATLRSPESDLIERFSMQVWPLSLLPPDAITEVLQALDPHLPPATIRSIARRCRGDLTLAREYLRLARHAPGDPSSMEEILLARCQHLSTPALRALERLACAGIPLRVEELRASPRAIAELLQNGLIRQEPPGVVLEHPRLGEVIRSTLPPTRQRRIYLHLGSQGARFQRDPQEIARWYTLGRSLQRALPFWREAFWQRSSQGLKDALLEMERFLRAQGGRFRGVAALLEARRAIWEGRYGDGERLLLRLVQKVSLRRYALLALASLYDWWERYDRMREVLIALFPYRHTFSPREMLEYWELLGIWHDMMGHLDRALLWYRTCLTHARKHRLRQEENVALFNMGWIFLRKRHLDQAQRYLEEGLDTAVWPFERATLLLRLGDVMSERGDFPHAVALYRKAWEEIQQAPFAFWENLIAIALARALTVVGNLSEALSFAQRSRHAPWVLLWIALYTGDREAVARHLPHIPPDAWIARVGQAVLEGAPPPPPDDTSWNIDRVLWQAVLRHQGNPGPS